MRTVAVVFVVSLLSCATHKLHVYFDNIERYIGTYLRNPSKYNETTLRTAVDSYSRRFAKFYLQFKAGSKSAYIVATVICNKQPPDWLQMYPDNLTLIQKMFKISDVDLDCMSISLYDLKKVWNLFLAACRTNVEYLKFLAKNFN